MTLELLFVLFCGLAFGSFVTLAVWRLPRGQDIVLKPSQCPQCKTKLGFRDLWPVFSWVCSKGTCRHCGKPIGLRYPAIELVTLFAFLLVYGQFGLTPAGVLVALFTVMLLIMVIVDLEYSIIPDQVHLALLPLGLAYHYTVGTPWEQVLYGFLAGLATGLLLHHGYRFLRGHEGLGYGDVKFFAVAGIWLTIWSFVPFLFFSGLFGVATGLIWRLLGKGPRFPFGPALAFALFMGVVWPQCANWFIDMEKSILHILNM